MRQLLLAFPLLVPAVLGAQQYDPWAPLLRPRTHAPTPTAPAITSADLKTRLYLFADDSMGGRLLGSSGNFKGVEYIAREVKRLGLEPAGDGGSYFQTVPVVDRSYDSTSAVSVGGTTLTPWVDFVPRDQGPGSRSLDGVPVVFGGTWPDSATLITPANAAGKLVVFALAPAGYAGAPGTANRGVLSARYKDAAGIAVAGMDLLGADAIANYKFPSQGVRPDVADPGPSYLYVTTRVASLLLGTSIDSAAVGATGRALSGTPRFTERPIPIPARNVVAILRGSDPALRNSYVAIGAHNDHIGTSLRPMAHDSMYVLDHLFRLEGADDPNPTLSDGDAKRLNDALAVIRKRTHGASARPDSIYNGADDDGSGSVSVLEIAEYFAHQKVKPKRSLLFVWHVGEEEGLYGSAYFTDHPTVPRDSIVAQLNIDMIGRGGAHDVTGQTKEGAKILGNANYVQLIGSRRVSTELGDLAERVNASGKHHLAFDYALDANGHPQNIYCRSDHYEYARYAIPIIFFTTGGHADYHQVTDEPQYIDYDRMWRVARFVADLAQHVGDLDHRPLVDKPRPDPHGDCVQ